MQPEHETILHAVRVAVTVSSWPGGTPRPGDVVAFRHPLPGRIVLHRVIQRLGDSFVARGDNRREADGRIPVTEILGRVTRVERRGRRVLLGLGAERVAIAILARTGLVPFLLAPAWRAIRGRIRMGEERAPARIATEGGPEDAPPRDGEVARRVPVDSGEGKVVSDPGFKKNYRISDIAVTLAKRLGLEIESTTVGRDRSEDLA